MFYFLCMHFLKFRAFSEFQNMYASPLDGSALHLCMLSSPGDPRAGGGWIGGNVDHIWSALVHLQRMFACVCHILCGLRRARRHRAAHLCTLLLHVLLFSPLPLPCSFRESRRSLLPPSSPLSQRDATAYRSVCQNQRCLGNPSRIPAVDQETGKWAVWGSMDGYAETQLLFD